MSYPLYRRLRQTETLLPPYPAFQPVLCRCCLHGHARLQIVQGSIVEFHRYFVFVREIPQVETKAERARLVCDFLAGMTDGYAVRMYQRLFSPGFGSIGDLVG